jgi:hypothetical protein
MPYDNGLTCRRCEAPAVALFGEMPLCARRGEIAVAEFRTYPQVIGVGG